MVLISPNVPMAGRAGRANAARSSPGSGGTDRWSRAEKRGRGWNRDSLSHEALRTWASYTAKRDRRPHSAENWLRRLSKRSAHARTSCSRGLCAGNRRGTLSLPSGLALAGNHPGELRPVRALSDYLQISPSSLQRLFEKHKGISVRQAALSIRMQAARQALQTCTISQRDRAPPGLRSFRGFYAAYKSFWKRAPSADRKTAQVADVRRSESDLR